MGDMRYTYANPGYLGTQIKHVLKDLDRGALNREEAAMRLRLLADKLDARTEVIEQLTFEELQDKIATHLRRNR